MDRMKTAQGGFPVMLAALVMALTVNAAFGVALSKASTNGQRIYNAWNYSGATMYADASSAVRKLCDKG